MTNDHTILHCVKWIKVEFRNDQPQQRISFRQVFHFIRRHRVNGITCYIQKLLDEDVIVISQHGLGEVINHQQCSHKGKIRVQKQEMN